MLKIIGSIFLSVLVSSIYGQEINQNKAAADLQDGLYLIRHSSGAGAKFAFYELEKIDQGTTDSEGNKVFHLLFKGDKDSIKLVPDFEPFPISFQISDGSRRYFIIVGDSYLHPICYDVYVGGLHRCPELDPCAGGQFYFAKTAKRKDHWLKNNQHVDSFLDDAEKHIAQLKKETKYGDVPGSLKQAGIIAAFTKEQYEKNKGLDLQQQANAMEDGEYRHYTKDGYGRAVESTRIKLTFIKEGGKVTQIKVQEPFTDGQFYDKEKFFRTIPVKSGDRKVEFSNKGNTQYLTIYAGMIFIVNYENRIWGMITRDGRHARNLLINNKYGGTTQHEYRYCNDELEEKYNMKKDWGVFQNSMDKYLGSSK